MTDDDRRRAIESFTRRLNQEVARFMQEIGAHAYIVCLFQDDAALLTEGVASYASQALRDKHADQVEQIMEIVGMSDDDESGEGLISPEGVVH